MEGHINTSKLVPGSKGIRVSKEGLVNLNDIAITMAGSYSAKALERLGPKTDEFGMPAETVTPEEAKEIIARLPARRNKEFRIALQEIIAQHFNPNQDDWKTIALNREKQLQEAHSTVLRLADCVIALQQKTPRKTLKLQRHPRPDRDFDV